MNQFHTPSFGDEMFEINDTPVDQAQHQTASRRISRLNSQDHNSLDHAKNDEEDPMDYDATNNTYANHLLSANQDTQEQPQLQPQHELQQQSITNQQVQMQMQTQTQLNQPPSKPLAPYALFFRDTLTAIKQQNPACTLDQITAIAHNMWESMDEKRKSAYDQRHEVEKREYIRQLRDYQRNQLEQQQSQPQDQSQDAQQLATGDAPSALNISQQPIDVPQADQPEQVGVPATDQPTVTSDTVNAVQTPAASTNNTAMTQPPDQIQLLTEAAAVQKCTRDQCNKPAIINPDWEDEYCSNECVVIHCRNVFNEWARSLQNSPT